MKHKKYKFTIGIIATLITIICGVLVISGKAYDCIDKKLEKIINERIDNNDKLKVCDKIQEDIEEIKFILEFMNKDNPEYKEITKAIKKSKEK